jgi:ABC-type transport system substrate-binding protein
VLWGHPDVYGNTPASYFPYYFLKEGEWRWTKYDPEYEKMWKKMAGTVDREVQEGLIREMEQYIYDRAYLLFIYSPITLYAANKNLNFVPYKSGLIRLKETSVTDNHWSVRTERK